MKDAQATGEVFSPQLRTSCTSNQEISSTIVGNFFPHGSGFHIAKRDPDPADRNLCESMRIRIHITAQNTPKIYLYVFRVESLFPILVFFPVVVLTLVVRM
jgi:hypothetical protein